MDTINIVVGIIFVIAISLLIYYLGSKTNKSKDPETKVMILDPPGPQSIRKKDVVLAKLIEDSGDISYAILWNGEPSRTYNYQITDLNGITIASGDVIAPTSGIVKIKGLPLTEGTTYNVAVDSTSIEVKFYPPNFIDQTLTVDGVDCMTDIVPTGIEILSSGNKVPLSRCQIKVDPENPGFSCQSSMSGEIILMIYNGENVVNILTLSI